MDRLDWHCKAANQTGVSDLAHFRRSGKQGSSGPVKFIFWKNRNRATWNPGREVRNNHNRIYTHCEEHQHNNARSRLVSSAEAQLITATLNHVPTVAWTIPNHSPRAIRLNARHKSRARVDVGHPAKLDRCLPPSAATSSGCIEPAAQSRHLASESNPEEGSRCDEHLTCCKAPRNAQD